MFIIGQKIYYPMHGVGVVEAIQELEVLGDKSQYYMLRFTVGRMTAMVPVHSAQSVGLRPIINAEECERIEEYLGQESQPDNENWNQRYRENLDKLRQGEIYGVADVVKSLIRRDRDKGLSAGERKMYLTAKQVLLAELMAASGKEEDEFLADIGD